MITVSVRRRRRDAGTASELKSARERHRRPPRALRPAPHAARIVLQRSRRRTAPIHAQGGVEVLAAVSRTRRPRSSPAGGSRRGRGTPRPGRPTSAAPRRVLTRIAHAMLIEAGSRPASIGVAAQPRDRVGELRPGGYCGIHPSAMRPVRRSTFSTILPNHAPIQIGIGRCTGIGLRPMRSRWCHSPSKVTSSSVQRRRSTSICSSMPRAAVGEVLVQRFVLHPVPPDSDAEHEASAGEQVELGACFATRTVWRWGRIRIPVTSSMRSVTAPR